VRGPPAATGRSAGATPPLHPGLPACAPTAKVEPVSVLTATLACLLAAAPAPRCVAPVEAGLGPVAAPVQMIAYLDPLAPGTLAVWLELRRLVSDFRGALRVEVEPITTTMTRDTATERLLRWFVAASDMGLQEAALRLIERDGRERLALRLGRPGGADALAAELGKSAEAIQPDRCTEQRIDASRRALRSQQQRAGGYLGRPPLFALSERLAVEDNGGLERVRSEVARELQLLRGGRRAGARGSYPPLRSGVSQRLVRPPAAAGMVVGGVGLPHRLVVFVEHDEHPSLGNLGPALEYRRQHPGSLAIQVIARGTTAAARQLRQRLCAAQHLGLELEYLRRLARAPTARWAGAMEAVPLTQRLDEAAEAHMCELAEAELEPGPSGLRGLPDGAWLDGTAVGQGDLEAIGVRIIGLEAAQRPLDAVFSAAAPAEL
jgi:hypothetical protein